MKIAFIHGHGASSDSFNFIHSQLAGEFRGVEWKRLEYDSNAGFANNLADMVAALQNEDEVFFICHSLGGLYALHLADRLGERCLGAVTIGTPYGGSESALWLDLLFPQRLFKDIHPGATPVTQGREIRLHDTCNWTAIITTRGHSNLMAAANDGVVSIDSMRKRSGVKFVEVHSTHHESLQSRYTVEIIQDALEELQVSA
jgi:pimeloyl-ACP methyl ester carboxylesterase